MKSESKVGDVRRAYEAPTARIVAVGSGCVVRASDGYWTAAPFDTPVDGDWGYDGTTTAAPFENEAPFGGLWCDGSNSSSAAMFGRESGEWGGDGGSSAGEFGKVEGNW